MWSMLRSLTHTTRTLQFSSPSSNMCFILPACPLSFLTHCASTRTLRRQSEPKEPPCQCVSFPSRSLTFSPSILGFILLSLFSRAHSRDTTTLQSRITYQPPQGAQRCVGKRRTRNMKLDAREYIDTWLDLLTQIVEIFLERPLADLPPRIFIPTLAPACMFHAYSMRSGWPSQCHNFSDVPVTAELLQNAASFAWPEFKFRTLILPLFEDVVRVRASGELGGGVRACSGGWLDCFWSNAGGPVWLAGTTASSVRPHRCSSYILNPYLLMRSSWNKMGCGY
jgi:hypothetical protein